MYVAVTRAQQRLLLNPKLAHQLQAFHLWDSLALQGTTSDSAVNDPAPVPCHGRGCSNANARGLATENPAGGDASGGGSQRSRRLLFVGSGSTGPLCQACVEGVAGEEGNLGLFPYASEFFAPRGTV